MNGDALRYDGDQHRPRQAERLPYLDHFGLSERPFVPERQHWLLEQSPVLQELIDKLLEDDWRELLLCGAAIAELQPLLCEHLAQALEAKYDVITLQADLLMSAEELLYRLSGALGLEEDASGLPEVLVHALTDHVLESQGRVQGVVLQIEDAHELSAEALSLLIMLAEAYEDEIPAKVILWGDSSLAPRVSQALKGRGVKAAAVQVPAFSREEVEDYLAFCLEEVGYEGELPFSESRLNRLYEESRAIPSRLHRLAEDALNEAARGRGFGLRLPLLHGVAAGALLLVLAALYVVPLPEFDMSASAVTRNITLEPRPVAGGQGSAAGGSAAGAAALASAGRPADPAALEPEEESLAASVLEEPSGPPVVNTTPLFEQRRAAAAGESAAAANADVQSAASPEQGQPAPRPAETVAVAPAQTPAPAPAAGAPSAAPSAAAGGAAEQHARLLALPEDQYVIQLFGSFSEANVQSLIAGSGLRDGLYYFETRYQGRPWFVALRGAFPSRAAADAAVAGLPASLRQGTPWVRPVKDIRAAIDAL